MAFLVIGAVFAIPFKVSQAIRRAGRNGQGSFVQRSICMKTELVRRCYRAYETRDREVLEGLLAPGFTFTSPIDDRIDRAAYFTRCWPNHESVLRFDLEILTEIGDEVCARYTGYSKDGSTSKNTEFFRFEGDRIAEVQVFFGSVDAVRANEEELRGVMESWADTIRRKDASALAAHFVKEPVLFFLAPPLQAKEPAEKNARDWFATWAADIGYEIEDLQIVAEGSVAYVHAFHHLTGKKTNGEEVDLWLRVTQGLKKIEGKWKFAHVHESVPFRMDGSEKAALDLKPNP